MRKATRTFASWLGILEGIAGLEHGYFEILQGNIKPTGLMFASMGSPCVPEKMWAGCEPAMSVIPNFLITGILTIILSLLIVAWSVIFIQRRNGGVVMILLCVALLLFGGGFFPPVFGFIAGIVALQINRPIKRSSAGSFLHSSAKAWPWPFVLFIAWGVLQFLVGYFFNDLLKSIMGVVLPIFVALLPISIFTAYASDVLSQADLRLRRYGKK